MSSTAASARPQNITLGIALILTAALAISVQDVIFKLFSSAMTLWQIFALRGCIAVPLLIAICWMQNPNFADIFRQAVNRWSLLRAVFITTTFLAFYGAIPFLSLSTLGAANYSAPIFVTLLAAFAIREPVGPRGWLGVLLGFVGVLVLLRPGSDAFSFWALMPIIGAAFYALGHIVTRARCQDIPTAALALSTNIVMMLAGFVVSGLIIWLAPTGGVFDAFPYVFGQWSAITTSDALVLIVLAAFAVGNGMLLAGAYQAAPPPTVATFEYSYLVFVAIWDIVFFTLMPSAPSILGMVMIVCAGLLVIRR
ncbi:MAG: DMT family transporter [Rhizobiaceae bacterium]|nr:DMT family transporter [Rhizobiaceae bacterium]